MITVVVTAPAQGATLTNTATVSSATPDPNPANNTATATTTVTAVSGPGHDQDRTTDGHGRRLAGVLARGGGQRPVGRGEPDGDRHPARRGDLRVRATGTGWACSNAGNVSVTCTRATLATGATAPTITLTVTAPAQAGSLTNTASVSATTADPVPANNTSSVTTGVTASADLAITKTGPATVVAGSSVSYQLSVVDNGPSDAANLTVTDTLPAGVTFVSRGRAPDGPARTPATSRSPARGLRWPPGRPRRRSRSS